MRSLKSVCSVVLCLTTALLASEGNSWNRIRYNGGTIQTRVDPKEWDNHLTVTSDLITLKLKDGQQIEIPTSSVTGLSYGQEAHRRVGTMAALGILVSPVALFGLMHKTRLHYIGIEYKTADNKGAGMLLQGDKGNYRAILTALQSATGAPLSVSEKDREYVPGMPNTRTVQEGEAPTAVGTNEKPQAEDRPAVAGREKMQAAERARCTPPQTPDGRRVVVGDASSTASPTSGATLSPSGGGVGSSVPLSVKSPAALYDAAKISRFDILDGVSIDRKNGTLTLFGHSARPGSPRPVPYLDYLAAALESNNPTFSLEWTPASRQSIDQAFNRLSSAAGDMDFTNRLAHNFDASGHLNKQGEFWFQMFGANVHAGMDKMSVWLAIFPAAGYPKAGQVMKAVDEVERTAGTSAANVKVPHDDMPPVVRQTPMEHLVSITSGMGNASEGGNSDTLLHTFSAAMNGDPGERQTLLRWVLKGIAIAYKLDENRYVNQFQSLQRSGTEWSIAFAKAVETSQDDTVQVQKNAFYALVGNSNRKFVHVPPEMMRNVLGASPVVVPVFNGLSRNSLLAQVAFQADVFGKNLMDMPEIKSDVPSYRTYFEWRQTVDRAPADEGHTWFAPDGFELIQSADGNTMVFGKTPIRIHMERYAGSGAGRQSVGDPLLRQYADELTSLYDPLAAKFPVLLDLRETMKVMAVAEWLKQKGIKLSFPQQGRGTWTPPSEYPGVIHMEMAIQQARVGEVMSASGGIDYRVTQNWKNLNPGQSGSALLALQGWNEKLQAPDIKQVDPVAGRIIACISDTGAVVELTSCSARYRSLQDRKKDLAVQIQDLNQQIEDENKRLKEANKQPGTNVTPIVNRISELTSHRTTELYEQKQNDQNITKMENDSVGWEEDKPKTATQPTTEPATKADSSKKPK